MEPVTPKILFSCTLRGAGVTPKYEHALEELTQKLVTTLTRVGVEVEQLDSGLGYVPKLTEFDGVLLMGDADIDPQRYAHDWTEEEKNRRRRYLKYLNAEADGVEIAIVKESLTTKTPMLGIGRGMQVINVALDGTLLPAQEVPYVGSVSAAAGIQRPAQERVRRELLVDGERVYKVAQPLLGELDQIRTIPGTTLAAALDSGREAIGVVSNSRMVIKNLAPGLRVSATTTEGHVEGLERDRTAFEVPLVAKAGWLLGVHWHPEEPRSPEGQLEGLIDSFTAAVRNKAKQRAAQQR